MEFTFSNQDTRDTTLSLSTGQAVYQTSTPDTKFLRTETISIKKFEKDGEHDMATVEIHSFHDDVCRVWGRDVVPKRDGLFTTAKTFTACDGHKYTWKTKLSGRLELKNESENVIAVFERSPTQMKLSIEEAGSSIADEIVATFVLEDQWTRVANSGSKVAPVIVTV